MDKMAMLKKYIDEYSRAYQECNTIEMRKAKVKIASLTESMENDVELYFKLTENR